MKKVLVTILLLTLVFAACKKNGSSGGFDLLSSDKKNEAAKIIESANQDLKKVKEIYKANQNRVDEELIPAMKASDAVKAKDIANDLVKNINDGLEAADDAIKKIKEAESMDINDTYKRYLELKREGMEKQIEAFELRRQVAQLLSQSFGGSDPNQINQAQAVFKDKELQFHKLMEEGKDYSEQANDVYKESLRKK